MMELIPCPYCDCGDFKVIISGQPKGKHIWEFETSITCLNCLHHVERRGLTEENSKEKAEEAWNRGKGG